MLHKRIPLATPLVIYIEPSGYCNLRCQFCPHGIGNEKMFKKDLMSINLFKKSIDGLSIFPDKIKLLRICGNGEPLMNKNITKMLQYAQEKKIAEKIELVTNGLLLTIDLIKNLPRFLDRIIVSIEGLCAEDYQRISGANINFQSFLDKLAVLYTHKNKCKIHIKIHNKAVSTTYKKTMFFKIFRGFCDEIDIENLVPMWPQFKTFFSKKNKFRWGGNVIKRRVCAQIFKGMQVQANGEVVPCCVDWNRVNMIGDINQNSLFEIWNGEKLKKLQIKHLIGDKSKIEPCKDCSMNDYCEIDNIDLHAKECLKRLKQ